MKQKSTPLAVLQTLWHKRMKKGIGNREQGIGAEESRTLRLSYISAVVGHAVASSKDLNAREMRRVIEQLRREEGTGNRGQAKRPLTREQLFKIALLEQWLGWRPIPERLGGFLRKWFKKSSAGELSQAQASKCITALFRVAAREEIKRQKGAGYAVGEAELLDEVKRLQQTMPNYAGNRE